MIYLVEGPDGAGKTKLINELLSIDNKLKECDIVPLNWPYQYTCYDYLFCKLLNDYDKDIIIDRSFISEMVYRIVQKDRKANITLCQIVDLLKDFPIKIIYCKSDTAFEDAISRGETYITTSEQHKYLTFVYDVIIDLIRQFTNVQVIDYNWKTDNIKKLIKKMKE